MSPPARDEATAVFAVARLARHVEVALGDVDLTLPQYRLLMYLTEQSGAAKQLADQTQVRPPSLTALVDGLSNRGLVERQGDPTDGRRIQLVVTAAGRALFEVATSKCAERLQEIAAFSPEHPIDELASWGPSLDAWRQKHRP
jgi:DNA-binding MarR family transcriptional regulator